jgi:hypothetical protein
MSGISHVICKNGYLQTLVFTVHINFKYALFVFLVKRGKSTEQAADCL